LLNSVSALFKGMMYIYHKVLVCTLRLFTQVKLLVLCFAAQFARKFYLAQWYRDCSMAIAKSSDASTETASVVSESASADVPQRRKKSRRQSDECANAVDAASISISGHCNDAQMELKQEQRWLLRQMQTGFTSAITTRFVFAVILLVFIHFRQTEFFINAHCVHLQSMQFFLDKPHSHGVTFSTTHLASRHPLWTNTVLSSLIEAWSDSQLHTFIPSYLWGGSIIAPSAEVFFYKAGPIAQPHTNRFG